MCTQLRIPLDAIVDNCRNMCFLAEEQEENTFEASSRLIIGVVKDDLSET